MHEHNPRKQHMCIQEHHECSMQQPAKAYQLHQWPQPSPCQNQDQHSSTEPVLVPHTESRALLPWITHLREQSLHVMAVCPLVPNNSKDEMYQESGHNRTKSSAHECLLLIFIKMQKYMRRPKERKLVLYYSVLYGIRNVTKAKPQ